MKIIFIGGVKFSLSLLQNMIKRGLEISALFTYTNDKKKFYSDMASFDKISKNPLIKNFYKVNSINEPANIKIIKDLQPDLILVMGWSQLLNEEIIKIPKLGVIGSHPTELPKFRGRSPIPWSILKDLKESALTFFYIESGVDNGDILDQKKFKIKQNDDASTIYKKITRIGILMLEKNLSLFDKGNQKRIKQDESLFIENWSKRVPSDGLICWSDDALEIHRLIRATTKPYPGAFTFFQEKKLIIWKADYVSEFQGVPGEIIQISPYPIISAKNGQIILKSFIFENHSKDKTNDIFSKIKIGTILN